VTEYSIIIPTYQGAASIGRLVESICNSAQTLGLEKKLEIVVVIDGSTDNTYELLSSVSLNVHMQIIEQQNAGLAQTRNRGIDAATGNLLWHLDDDMEIETTCMAQHLLNQRQPNTIRMGSLKTKGEPSILLEHVNKFYQQRHLRLNANSECVEPLDFTCSNTSGSAEIFANFRFNNDFRGYGMEDYELATRLNKAGIPIIYEPLAEAVHHYDHTFTGFCKSMYEEGFNRVHICQLHPELLDRLFATPNNSAASFMQRRAFKGDRHLLTAFHTILRFAANNRLTASRICPKSLQRRLFHYAISSARFAGIAKACAQRSIQ